MEASYLIVKIVLVEPVVFCNLEKMSGRSGKGGSRKGKRVPARTVVTRGSSVARRQDAGVSYDSDDSGTLATLRSVGSNEAGSLAGMVVQVKRPPRTAYYAVAEGWTDEEKHIADYGVEISAAEARQIQSVGVQVNPEKWTMADNLVGAMRLAADLRSSGEEATDEEFYDVLLPYSMEQLMKERPCAENGWTLRKPNMRDQYYAIVLKPFAEKYPVVAAKVNALKNKKYHVAVYGTMKGYLGEGIEWFFGLGALNPELPKAEICKMGLLLIHERYRQHCDMVAVLKDLLKEYVVRAGGAVEEIASETAEAGQVKMGEEQSLRETGVSDVGEVLEDKKPAADDANEGSEDVEHSSVSNEPVAGGALGGSVEFQKAAGRSATSVTFDLGQRAGKKDVESGKGAAGLVEGSDVTVKKVAPAVAVVFSKGKCEGPEVEKVPPARSHVGAIIRKRHLEGGVDPPGAKARFEGTGFDADKEEEGDMFVYVPQGISHYVIGEHPSIEVGTRATVPGSGSGVLEDAVELSEDEEMEIWKGPVFDDVTGALGPPRQLFRVHRNLVFVEIMNFVHHMQARGILPESLHDPMWEYLKIAMDAWEMHDPALMGEAEKDYRDGYKTWLVAIHHAKFEGYMSAFAEILLKDEFVGDDLNTALVLRSEAANCELSEEEQGLWMATRQIVDDFIEDFLEHAPESFEQNNWDVVIETIQSGIPNRQEGAELAAVVGSGTGAISNSLPTEEEEEALGEDLNG